MKTFPFPLRISLPIMLFFLGSGLSLYAFFVEVSKSYQRQEKEAMSQVTFSAQQTSTILEYIFRKTTVEDHDSEVANVIISQMGNDSHIELAVLLDEQNQVIFSTDYQLKQTSVKNTMFATIIPQLQEVRSNQKADVIVGKNKDSLIAIYPIYFQAKKGEIRPSRVGLFTFKYDLSQGKKIAFNDALNKALQMTIVVMGACLVIWYWFYESWKKRADQLVNVTISFAQGNLSDRSNLIGKDELAQISKAFDQMADQIENDTHILKQSKIELELKAEQLKNTLLELQKTQAKLIQNEKMSSLGELVAGVAHEINNPVSFIYGNLVHANHYIKDLLYLIELYENYYPQPHKNILDHKQEIDLEFMKEDLIKLINSMRIGTERIQEIVKSLRIFSRLDEAEVKQVNIHDGIDSTLMILKHRLKAQNNRPEIIVNKNYGDLPLINCYAGQINQVFMNILANAIDAFEDQKKDHTFEEILTDPHRINITTEIGDHNHIKIMISDNGLGIPEAVKSRIFDPFFTTKPVGKGTGMGLAISYQIIVEKHQGKLICHSENNQGTTFIIEIPQSNDIS